MNSPKCTRATRSIEWVRGLTLSLAALLLLLPLGASAEWKIDLSRRQKAMRDAEVKNAPRSPASDEKGVLDFLFDPAEPIQEIVVLNTTKGFVPATLRMRKGARYLVHVVNVNEKDKNVSFVLDAFAEHHATYYGEIKSFRVEPKKEGTYSFQCPETSAEGRLVVFAPDMTVPMRAPASKRAENE